MYTLQLFSVTFLCAMVVAVSPELVIFAQGIWAQAQGRRGPVTEKLRKYLMYYRGPGFLAVICFGSFPLPSPSHFSKLFSLSQSSCVSAVELAGWRRGWGEGSKSYDDEKAWSSMNH